MTKNSHLKIFKPQAGHSVAFLNMRIICQIWSMGFHLLGLGEGRGSRSGGLSSATGSLTSLSSRRARTSASLYWIVWEMMHDVFMNEIYFRWSQISSLSLKHTHTHHGFSSSSSSSSDWLRWIQLLSPFSVARTFVVRRTDCLSPPTHTIVQAS